MKLLVIGGSGLIGWHLLLATRQAGHKACGTYRQNPLPGLVPLDGADGPGFQKLLDSQQPEAVIHAAGFTWVDGCEDDPDRSQQENTLQPARMARQCQQRGIRFVYLSTSYIFDGRDGPYAETASPNPVNVYSRCKWAGEQQVQAACDGSALVPRVVCVYGAEARQKNFAYQVWRALAEGRPLRLPADQCGNPTYAGDVARWILRLLERQETGVWHLGGPQPECARPQWAQMLVEAFAAQGIHPASGFCIESVTSDRLQQRAPRPLQAGMLTDKLATLDMPPTDVASAVRALVRQDREWFAEWRHNAASPSGCG